MIKSIVAASLLTTLGFATTHACDGLEVEVPWIRTPPPGMSMTAGYMRVTNRSAQDRTITRISNDLFGSAELHETRTIESNSRMVHLDSVLVPAGGTVTAHPGGMHLMLSDTGEALTGRESVSITFHCDDGNSVEFEAPFRKRGLQE